MMGVTEECYVHQGVDGIGEEYLSCIVAMLAFIVFVVINKLERFILWKISY